MSRTADELVIMVVEDHGFQRKTLMHQIRALGYQQLLEAADGIEALALCQSHTVDILFCDLRMPGMDGMALLRRLSLGGFRGGIILSSALEDDVVEAVLRMSAAYGLHVLGRIEKPSSPAAAAPVDRLLGTQVGPLGQGRWPRPLGGRAQTRPRQRPVAALVSTQGRLCVRPVGGDGGAGPLAASGIRAALPPACLSRWRKTTALSIS